MKKDNGKMNSSENNVEKDEITEGKRKEITDEISDDIEKKEDSDQEKEDKDELKKRIEDLEKKLYDMTEQVKRSQADFVNYKKRTEKEKMTISTYALENIMTDLLQVLDNFDRAMDSMEDKESEFYKGIELIDKQLFSVMEKYGIEEIDAEGNDFDPNMHHAVLQEEKENTEPGKVIDVMQKGFKLKDRVLRAAMVKVSK